ncbi:glycosyltransferase family 71 protein [Gonapodya prolifera JEL478]|uniref:Glycosyltransferase family 71 protein n=1 Tax=Gonapodya prolifera (strain JEL478) TaxID=1344416 RepID=A0A139AF50_GONPJ|nr:glycosyltransferase family 71 protein [Gonapodya prolifera JEL478]|eukprot:KXS15309.1 glycosyltransferase family 71 protein [Gonapodya prolifera JEL478]
MNTIVPNPASGRKTRPLLRLFSVIIAGSLALYTGFRLLGLGQSFLGEEDPLDVAAIAASDVFEAKDGGTGLFFGHEPSPEPRSLENLLRDIDGLYERREELVKPIVPVTADTFAVMAERVRDYVLLHSTLMDVNEILSRHCGCSNGTSRRVSRCCSGTWESISRTAANSSSLALQMESVLFPWSLGGSLLSLYTSFLEQAPRSRGIVLTAGKGMQTRMAVVSIRSIRAAGCVLPIEVYYSGDADLDAESRARLVALGNGYDVTVRDITKIVDPVSAGLRGWAAKPFAAMFTSFAEVILQDADVVWVRSPDEMFRDEEYERTGTLFHFDRRTFTKSQKKRQRFVRSLLAPHLKNIPPPRENYILRRKSNDVQDSGIVLINKSRRENFYGLLATCKLNAAKESVVTYDHVHGDKDTFWLGWEVAGFRTYCWERWPVVAMGYLTRGDQSPLMVVYKNVHTPHGRYVPYKMKFRICSLQLTHLDRTGKHIFWFNGSPLRDKYRSEDSATLSSDVVWIPEHFSSLWEPGERDTILCLRLNDGLDVMVDDNGNVSGADVLDAAARFLGEYRTVHLGNSTGSTEQDTSPLLQTADTDELPSWLSYPRRLGKDEARTIDSLQQWWTESDYSEAKSEGNWRSIFASLLH